MRIPLSRALLLTLGGTLAIALLVGGVTLERRLAAELEAEALEDLVMVPPLVADRQANRAETLRMHARELAGHPDLGSALRAGDRAAAIERARAVASAWSEAPVVIDTTGEVWVGPAVAATIAPAETGGDGPYAVLYEDGALHGLALSPVEVDGRALGVVGVALTLGGEMSELLGGLTRADVAIVGMGDRVVAATLPDEIARAVVAASGRPVGDGVVEIDLPQRGRIWRTMAPLGGDGSAYFVRAVDEELAALPRLRRAGLLAAGTALGITLLVGLVMAGALSRPVRALAEASRGLARGDFDRPLPDSRLSEVRTVSGAFADMRSSLARRLRELAEANEELENRQRRLQALQTELVQRDRLVAAGRLVTELAHEIRNPVANVRNSLEVVRRHVDEPKAREFTDLAIAELLRMHDLAERMLDLNRPASSADQVSDVRGVIDDVVALAGLGDREGRWPIAVSGECEAEAAIAPDSLKQVLLNLLANAREAMPDGGPIELRLARTGTRVRIEVLDRGAGIPEEIRPHVFDPFFTTKEEVHGVGLGLFIAEGVVRAASGSLETSPRGDGSGTAMVITLPAREGAA